MRGSTERMVRRRSYWSCFMSGVDVREDEPRAFAAGGPRDGLAHAGRGPRDDDDVVAEIQEVRYWVLRAQASRATSKRYTRAVLPPTILACSSAGTPARISARIFRDRGNVDSLWG